MNDLIVAASLLRADADEIKGWALRLSMKAAAAKEALEADSPDADAAERAIFEGLNMLDSILRTVIRNSVGNTQHLATHAYAKGKREQNK